MRRPVGLVSAIVLSVLLAACSGGSNGSSQSAPAVPSFVVSLSPGSVNLVQGGPSESIQVSITAKNNFSGTVSVSASGLPGGVTISPASLSLTPSASGTFNLSASNLAVITQSSLTITGVSGSLTENASLAMGVTGQPVPDPFHMIGGEFSHGFYDQARKLLFIPNFGLNEVDVVSGVDFSVQARVPAPQPFGIDQMADGTTLVIGTFAQQVLTLDESSLVVTPHPVPDLGTLYGLFYPNVVALANGKILMIGQEPGIDSNDILDGGQYLIEWDSNSGAFSQVEPTTVNPIWETDHLARSADHKWAVFSADQFYLYSSDADSFTSLPLDTPPQNLNGISGYVLNSDGSKIAVVTGQQVTFLDRSFNVLGAVPIPGAFPNAGTAETFNSDDSQVLLQYETPLALEVLDANKLAALGFYTGASNAEDNDERLLAIDPNGRAFAGMSGGVRVIDMTAPPIVNPSNGNFSGPWCPLPTTTAAPLNTSEHYALGSPGPNDGISYYFGGEPAPLLSNATQIAIPPSSITGPVNIECIAPNGGTFVYAAGFSYGVDIIGASANFVPASGNPSAYVYGFGFSQAPTISVANQSVTVLGVSSPLNLLQVAQFHVPNGTPDESASVAVSSANGSGSLAQAMTYIPAVTIVPASGLMQVLFDSHRNLLYALQATQVSVLNASTLQWQSPIPIPGAGGSTTYNLMALSPDGSYLVVESPTGKLAITNPDNPSQAKTVPITSDTDGVSQPVVITKNNQALVAAPWGSQNNVVDLSSLTVTSFTGYLGQLVRASADGSAFYGVDLNVSSGQVYSIDPTTFAVQSPQPFGYVFWTDLAVSTSGSQFAAVGGSPGTAGDIVGFYNSAMNLLNLSVYPLVSPPDDVQVLGSTFSSGGKVVVVPLGDSIEFWDVANGTLRARLMTPEELPVLVYPEAPVAPQIALDATGQTIFAISASGLTVLKLPETIDNISPTQWGLAQRNSKQGRGTAVGVAARMAEMRPKRSMPNFR